MAENDQQPCVRVCQESLAIHIRCRISTLKSEVIILIGSSGVVGTGAGLGGYLEHEWRRLLTHDVDYISLSAARQAEAPPLHQSATLHGFK